MNDKSLLIGGLLPTVLLKLGTVLMKLSMREGSSVPNYLVHATPPQGGFFTPFAVSVARSRTGENANCSGKVKQATQIEMIKFISNSR